jgi:ATP-binding cassette, subfamily B, bacterial PglK
LKSFATNIRDLFKRVFHLAAPYGRKKLAGVLFLSLTQGVFQILGVTSIFPFLALAADPDRLRNSPIGTEILSHLPPMDDSRLLVITGCMAIAMLLISNLVNMFAEWNQARYAHGFGHWLRVGLLQKIASRPYGDFLERNSGLLLKKVNGDVSQYVHGVLLPLLESVSRLITIALMLLTLLVIHPQVAIGAAAIFGLFYGWIFGSLGKRRRETADGLKRANRGIMIEAQQMLGGIKSVKVHCVEEAFLGRFHTYSKEYAQLMARLPIFQSGPRYLIEPLAFGGVVLVVLVYAARGQNFAALLPSLGVMALAGYRLLPALQMLYGQMTGIATMRHALDEVYDEFVEVETILGKENPGIDGRFSRPKPFHWDREIRLSNLSFCYPGASVPVIRNFELSIPKNSSLGIVGKTGSGKSTLVDIILGLHAPTDGQILVDGAPLTEDNRRAWRRGIGYVPQDIFLIDDTIAANIAFGVSTGAINQVHLREAAKAAQILDFIESELPNQWDTTVGERGVRLSGGQRQRIGLARALYHRPSLLILDEATSALDHHTESEVMKAIRVLSNSITIIIIAHRLTTIDHCTQQINLGTSVTDESLVFTTNESSHV